MKKILLPLLIMLFSYNAVKAQCNAAFTATTNQATATFTASSSSNLYHHWNFGDGTTGSGVITTHTYSMPGTYHIMHVVIDSLQQCGDSASQNIVINFSDTNCISNFNSIRQSMFEYKLIYSGHNSTPIQNYTWKVDGIIVNSSPSSQTYLHTFTSSGTYNVCLTIQTAFGCVSTFCKNVIVNVDTCNPTLSFTHNVVGSNGKVLRFTPTTNIQSPRYNWNFGDGYSSNFSTPTHTYQLGGLYTVTLSAIDSLTWCSKTIQQQVYVSGASDSCTASFTHNQSNNGVVAFTANSNQIITSQLWHIYYLPDSTQNFTIVGNNPTHQFTQNGSYLVCLTLTTNTGCVKTYCNTITVTSAFSLTNNFIPSYPNPAFNDKIKLNVSLLAAEKIKIKVVNILGNIVSSAIYNGVVGNNQIPIMVNNFAKGQYYIEIIYEGNRKYSYFQKL